MPEKGWHVLRHTFASQLVRSGTSINVVRDLLGHQDIKVTMRYLHASQHCHQDAVEALNDPSLVIKLNASEASSEDNVRTQKAAK